MNFVSKYVLLNADGTSSVRYHELKGGIPAEHAAAVLATAEGKALRRHVENRKTAASGAPASGGRVVYERVVDTNVLAVDLDKLTLTKPVVNGPPTICTGCQAASSNLSEATGGGWACEYCGARNPSKGPTLPAGHTIDYIIEPGEDESKTGPLTVFCLDTSGSMELPETPGDHGGTTRLQMLAKAVKREMENMRDPSRVAVVSFGQSVTIVGDGFHDPIELSGGILSDFDGIQGAATGCTVDKTISESREALSDEVDVLEPSGRTALGPAVLASVVLACTAPGSKVLLCTDGLANVGLGSVEKAVPNKTGGQDLVPVARDERRAAASFYSRIGDMAKSSGVVIDVVGIEGEHCDLEMLGRMAIQTNGQVITIGGGTGDTDFGGREVAESMEDSLPRSAHATCVDLSVRLNEALVFRERSGSGQCAKRDIGNAAPGTIETFEFGPKHRELSPKCLPFQAQIKFTRGDGAKVLRVISKVRPTTAKRAVAEKGANTAVLRMHAVRESAELAGAGDYTAGRATAMLYGRVIKRIADSSESADAGREYEGWAVEAAKLDLALPEVAATEEEDAKGDDGDEDMSYGREVSEEVQEEREVARSKNDALSKLIISQKLGGEVRIAARAREVAWEDEDTEGGTHVVGDETAGPAPAPASSPKPAPAPGPAPAAAPSPPPAATGEGAGAGEYSDSEDDDGDAFA